MPQNNKKKQKHKKKHHNNRNLETESNQENGTEEISEKNEEKEMLENKSDAVLAQGNGDQNNNEVASLAYEMKQSEVFGRYLVAAKDLVAGEIVLEVPPLAVGPCPDTDPVCIGCLCDFSVCKKIYKCPGCGWRICSMKCRGLKISSGHSTWECTALRENRIADFLDKSDEAQSKYMYETLMVLRCLLLKTNENELYKKLIQMEAHNEIRKNIPALWNRNQDVIVNRIRNQWKISTFSEEEIHTICGILEVNSFEVGQNNVKARALYPTAYLLAHDCTPNTTHTDHPKSHELTVRVTRDVLKGGIITLSYAYTLQGTIKRRQHLKDCKFFWCSCKRCADPSEFGTYCSALVCPKCKAGIIISNNSLQIEAPWKCISCRYTVTAKSILLLFDKLFLELDSLDPESIDQYEEFIKKYRNVLHPNHYLFLSAKHSLCQLYGRSENKLIQDMSLEELEHKETLCRELLDVCNKFEPGMTRLRGIILYELHAPIMLQATRLFESKKISGQLLKNKLKEVIKLLTESEQILSFEPAGSPEYEMTQAARDAMKRIGPI